MEREQKTMLELCIEHNSSLPVNRLAPETLSYIMVLVQCTEYVSSDGGRSQWSPAYVQVCVRWRRIALATSKIWYLLDAIKPRLALALCKRFPKNRLRLFYRPSAVGEVKHELDALHEIVLRYPSRISALHIEGARVAVHSALPQFQTYAPALQVLHLEPPELDDTQSKYITGYLQSLHAPNLRELRLYHLSPNSYWGTPWLRALSLRSLTITPGRMGSLPGLHNVLATLEALSSLEVLELHGRLPEEILSLEPSSSTRRVHLPLRHIQLLGTGLGVVSLLRHLVFTKPLHKFVTKCVADGPKYFPQIWHYAEPHCPSSPRVDLIISEDCIRIRFRPATILEFVSLSWDETEQILQSLKPCLPRLNISKLKLDDELGALPPELSRSILVECRTIQHLQLGSSDAVQIIFDVMRVHRAENDGVQLLPELRALRISHVEHAPHSPWFGPLRAELARRQANSLRNGSLPLRTLILKDCEGLDETEIDLLREIEPRFTVEVLPDAESGSDEE